VLRYRLDGDRIQSGLLLERGAKENFFLLTIQPPRRIPLEEIPPREYIFVVDVSGSMMGFPLETSKAYCCDLIRTCARPTASTCSRSREVRISGRPARCLRHSRTSGSRLPRWVSKARAAATELLAAYGGRASSRSEDGPVSRSIVIVTDGYIDADVRCFEYIRGHLDRSNVFGSASARA
jgi:Ca-activated chloride channel family protein